MTLTPEQLDELEAKLRDPHEYPHGIGTRASFHLVAVYRAALAFDAADRAAVEWEERPSREEGRRLLAALHDARLALQAALRGTP